MRLLGIASVVAMALVGVGVGARLLRLWRRTRCFPELAVGLGLLLVAAVGGPVAALARAPGLVGTTAGSLLFALGLACVQGGIGLFFAFNWRVFRPASPIARAVAVAAAAALAIEWAGLLRASSHGASMEEMLPHTRPWGIAIVATVAVAFAWSAAESFRYHAMLRRRRALGLGDPVVANRFLLWAIAGAATALLCGAVGASMLAGLAPLRHALPLGSIALAALAASACWTLAFVPPAAYLRRLRARPA